MLLLICCHASDAAAAAAADSYAMLADIDAAIIFADFH